jgi:peroxiredoxin
MRLAAGDDFPPHQLVSITGDTIAVPDQQQLVHLQLRRFAGCPVCNLHLRSMVVRSGEIAQAGVHEVVVFHSDPEELRRYSDGIPFELVGDPDKQLYREFGVESGPRAVLKPGAWPGIVGGLGRSLSATLRRREPPPPLKPHGGSLGLPADFLIASDGRVLAAKYGEHAYDQWSVDELLTLAGKASAEAA